MKKFDTKNKYVRRIFPYWEKIGIVVFILSIFLAIVLENNIFIMIINLPSFVFLGLFLILAARDSFRIDSKKKYLLIGNVYARFMTTILGVLMILFPISLIINQPQLIIIPLFIFFGSVLSTFIIIPYIGIRSPKTMRIESESFKVMVISVVFIVVMSWFFRSFIGGLGGIVGVLVVTIIVVLISVKWRY